MDTKISEGGNVTKDVKKRLSKIARSSSAWRWRGVLPLAPSQLQKPSVECDRSAENALSLTTAQRYKITSNKGNGRQ